MKTFQVDENGYYGRFGGAYVPEILYRCVKNLQDNYLTVMQSEAFRREFDQLLRDYVGRPSPLYFARRLSERYGCRIYLKREDLNHTGAHKINNTIGQILIAQQMGKTRIIAETGAGQHGVATATVCALKNMRCIVYMGKTDVERQHTNVQKMKMLGAEVRPVTSGNMTLKDATNEAIRDWCCHPTDTHYIIGSTVGPHPYPDMVARLQSVISEEIRKQLQQQECRDYPDYLIACVGGGSNAAGTIYHYIDDRRVKIVLAEAGGKGVDSGLSAATIHLGRRGYYSWGQNTGHAERGRTDRRALLDLGRIGLSGHRSGSREPRRAKAGDRAGCRRRRSAVCRIRTDASGRYHPALESAHALGALPKMHFKPEDVVVLTVSGRGDKDIETYIKQMKNDENISL